MNVRINRKIATALLVATSASLWAAAPALGAGGRYSVIECSPYNRSHDAAENTDAGYDVTAYCADAGHEYAMQVNRTGQQPVNQFRSGYWYWQAPPNTAIVGIDVEGKLRNDGGSHARLTMGDASGHPTLTFAHGSSADAHWTTYHWSGAPQARLIASLGCEINQCGPSDAAKTWVRNLTIKLVDNTDPSLMQCRWLAARAGVAAGYRRHSRPPRAMTAAPGLAVAIDLE